MSSLAGGAASPLHLLLITTSASLAPQQPEHQVEPWQGAAFLHKCHSRFSRPVLPRTLALSHQYILYRSTNRDPRQRCCQRRSAHSNPAQTEQKHTPACCAGTMSVTAAAYCMHRAAPCFLRGHQLAAPAPPPVPPPLHCRPCRRQQLLAPMPGRQQLPLPAALKAAASAAAALDDGQQQAAAAEQQKTGWLGVFHPLSDPALNSKLLMLCTGEGRGRRGASPTPSCCHQVAARRPPVRHWPPQLHHTPVQSPRVPAAAQMLSSVATLLHDTYLPLFMSEVLHMSNTRVRTEGWGGGGVSAASAWAALPLPQTSRTPPQPLAASLPPTDAHPPSGSSQWSL